MHYLMPTSILFFVSLVILLVVPLRGVLPPWVLAVVVVAPTTIIVVATSVPSSVIMVVSPATVAVLRTPSEGIALLGFMFSGLAFCFFS